MNRKSIWFYIVFILGVGFGMFVMRGQNPELSVQNNQYEPEILQEPETIEPPIPEIPTVIEPEPIQEVISPQYTAEEIEQQQQSVLALCDEIGNKLGSVSVESCLDQKLVFGGAYTANKRPLPLRDFLPENQLAEKNRILILGGIHGDEYSSISIMFKWMAMLSNSTNQDLLWRFIPSANPDGLLDGKAVRQNANGVDLNRNFPSQDWDALAIKYWHETTGSNPRRDPGETSASEPEVQWIVEQIKSFKPAVIISVHAPYHLLDFDGPAQAPHKIGELYLHELGVYPGSLGNYAGVDLDIPVVTLELPSAGIMPSDEQIENMWRDLLSWVLEHTSQNSLVLQ